MSVLIAGAGPVGLTLACELVRRGVACRVVDAAEGPSETSRALGVWPRTLEILDELGIAGEAVARGRRLQALNYHGRGRRLARLEVDPELETPFPFGLILPQSDTEALLAARMEGLGGEIEWGTALRAVDQDDEGVTTTLTTPAGAEERVRSGWLVGADGARSETRRTLGLEFTGASFDDSFLLADAGLELDLEDHEGQLFLSPEGVMALFPLPHGGHRVFVELQGVRPEEPDLELLQEKIDRIGPGGIVAEEPRWMSIFRISDRIAAAYRRDRCLLAGDAAHIHSPIGGQGMNLGIQDAYNLGWKLALVARGRARPDLLDSYEAERRPVARAVIRATRAATRFGLVRSPAVQVVRDAGLRVLDWTGAIETFGPRAFSQLWIRYGRSELVREGRGTRRWDARRLEGGPSAGVRAPDGSVVRAATGERERLFHILRDTRHALLLFAGLEPIEGGVPASLVRLGEEVRERLGDEAAVHLIVPGRTNEGPDGSGSATSGEGVLIDEGAGLHLRYGARSRCLYLIRPDGHVAHRSLPPDRRQLLECLAAVFGNTAAPAGRTESRPTII